MQNSPRPAKAPVPTALHAKQSATALFVSEVAVAMISKVADQQTEGSNASLQEYRAFTISQLRESQLRGSQLDNADIDENCDL